MNDTNKPVLFFDFDGVLVDSFDFVVDIAKELNSHVDASLIRWVMEGNVMEQLQELKRRTGFVVDHDHFDQRYGAHLAGHPLIAGMKEAIEDVARDHSLAIVSSSHSDPIKSFLDTQGISQHFGAVLGKDVHPKKTHKMQTYLAKFGGQKQPKSLLVTDSLGDIEEAHSLAIPSLAVSWGYHPEQTLRKGNPHAIVHKPEDLPQMIRDLLFGS
ncbi:HAD hydrolase-like protein [Candidatus Uhrbacteria bacterium]|nr:HAD hydrolase-like protein [Candidatus Uhrbacteria bacterium]